jgi:hypothetical protein
VLDLVLIQQETLIQEEILILERGTTMKMGRVHLRSAKLKQSVKEQLMQK